MGCRHSRYALPRLRTSGVCLDRRPHNAFVTVLRIRREGPSGQREYTRRGNLQAPVQIVFAGKAHPRDDAGKALIQQVVKLAQQKGFRRRLVFLEDYDMAVARYLVQGSDIWLNTPLRPQEASGTSGMKVLPNGGLNLSILDGWWEEAWQDAAAQKRFIGWAIGNGESYTNRDDQDQVESAALYALLERDIVPGFYERSADGLP